MFHLITNSELDITLDMSGVDDNLPSVAFDIVISWSMPYQKYEIQNMECWFECSEIDSFENSISELIKKQDGNILLKDLSGNPIIRLIKSDLELKMVIYSKDTTEMGKLTFEVSGYASELQQVLENLRKFEKWW